MLDAVLSAGENQAVIEIWTGLTQPQATLFAAAVTVFGALFGIWMGAMFFGGKVRDLKSALETSKRLLDEHTASVDTALMRVGERLERISDAVQTVDIQVAANSSSVAQIQSDVIDIQESVGQAEGVGESDLGKELRTTWNVIRDRLESLASDESIDGRTRAKYSRIDRRRYPVLIESMARDGTLRNSDLYREAVEIWHRYKNGRREPGKPDVARMAIIETALK